MQAAFLFTVVGTTGFVGVLAGQLPGVTFLKILSGKLLSRFNLFCNILLIRISLFLSFAYCWNTVHLGREDPKYCHMCLVLITFYLDHGNGILLWMPIWYESHKHKCYSEYRLPELTNHRTGGLFHLSFCLSGYSHTVHFLVSFSFFCIGPLRMYFQTLFYRNFLMSGSYSAQFLCFSLVQDILSTHWRAVLKVQTDWPHLLYRGFVNVNDVPLFFPLFFIKYKHCIFSPCWCTFKLTTAVEALDSLTCRRSYREVVIQTDRYISWKGILEM